MARTAIVNPRRKRRTRRAANRKRVRRHGRRRNAASSDRNYNPRRRRRAPARRRRNPSSPISSVYSSGGYRRKNPDMFDIDNLTEKMPAATLGVMAARFAMKMAGPFDRQNSTTNLTTPGPALPGVKHAIAMVLGVHFGAQMVGNLLGSGKTLYAECGGLGFAGDLFARTRFLNDSEWAKENLYLSGENDDDGSDEEYMNGFENQSALGAGEYVVGPDGTLYQMSGVAPDPAGFPGGSGGVAGFENQSALGRAHANSDSSFGYAR